MTVSDSSSNRNSPELMKHQKRLFDMLSGEDPLKKDRDDSSSNSRLRNADQFGGGSAGGNDRIDKSPVNDQTVAFNNRLVSLASEYPSLV